MKMSYIRNYFILTVTIRQYYSFGDQNVLRSLILELSIYRFDHCRLTGCEAKCFIKIL